MNREEAIKHLETYSTTNGSGQTTQAQHEEAKRMAIKALEQEPSGEAIDRRLVCAFIDGLISDDGERKKGLEYIRSMPPVNPQKPKSEWEYDHAILRAYSDGANDVLDKIRAEIETKYGRCDICEYFEDYDYEENDISEYRPIGDIADILQIIDHYKAESEETNASSD